MLQYKYLAFFEKFLTYYALAGLFSSLMKVLSVSEQKFHYFMLFLNFIDSKYSFLRRII